MTDIIILAAGRGTRMESEGPKVLQLVLGRPIIHYLLDALLKASLAKEPIVVVSPDNKELIKRGLINYPCRFAVQEKQLGTGHAIKSVFSSTLALEKNMIVVLGDHASYSPSVFKNLNQKHLKSPGALTMATTTVPHYNNIYHCFYSFGRIKRNGQNRISGIVELNDANEKEKEIKEVNPSLYVFETKWLKTNIDKIEKNPKKGEYYLTDIVAIAVAQNKKINSVEVDPLECLGINTLEDLKRVERQKSAELKKKP